MGYGDALFCLTPDKRVSAANFAEMIPRMAVYDAVICERPHPPIAPEKAGVREHQPPRRNASWGILRIGICTVRPKTGELSGNRHLDAG